MKKTFLSMTLIGALAALIGLLFNPTNTTAQSSNPVASSSIVKPDFKLVGQPPYPLRYEELYTTTYNLRSGLIHSDYLRALDGQIITIEGYVTPVPTGLDLPFTFLTQIRLSFCPCYYYGGDIPDEMMMVYFNGQVLPSTTNMVRATGRLEIKTEVDEHTGFVSGFRMYADKFEIVGVADTPQIETF